MGSRSSHSTCIHIVMMKKVLYMDDSDTYTDDARYYASISQTQSQRIKHMCMNATSLSFVKVYIFTVLQPSLST